ncbi:uncharacterized protein EV420DRAFT_88381 [Desarmillaria tabescens]|uniref:Uncharacterized protein n=1 Tax=Armillaria tabescens TaxID=1929756 RepID=A0AA39NQP8_ARMTA|nr:uncharacterized protein EV420DRAFT_88381 [Desarmillaria tabescens]KAK0470071.1 hypothetical protein EV420DRAFT_88381 [Desarmillaria tabescens]
MSKMELSISDAVFIAVVVEVLLYGMYTCLFLGSSYILIFKKEKSKVVVTMIVLNTIMWSVSTTHVTINLIKIHWVYLRGAEKDNIMIVENNMSPGLYPLLALECVNFFIGDGIVLWRAWILCNRSRRILWVSSILLVTAFVTAAVALLHTLGSSPPLSTTSDRPFASARAIIAMILTLSINVWATSLIAYRTWTHYRLIRSLTGSSFASQFCKKHGILSLIIESGVFYCCTWFATIIIAVSTSNGIYILFCMLAQLTAIYPTLIIALVCLRSTLDVTMQSSQQMSRTQQIITGSDSSESSNRSISMFAPQLIVEIETTTSSSYDNVASIIINRFQEDNIRLLSESGSVNLKL